nr:hypothetical protein [Tanacetum cinerariifolium]
MNRLALFLTVIARKLKRYFEKDLSIEPIDRVVDGVMDTPTIFVPANSSEGNFGDTIDIGVDVTHPVHVALVFFLAATVRMTLAQHREAIRGIQEHLLGVPIPEELTTLRFRVDVAEGENASLRATIRIIKAIEMVTRNHERLAHIEI